MILLGSREELDEVSTVKASWLRRNQLSQDGLGEMLSIPGFGKIFILFSLPGLSKRHCCLQGALPVLHAVLYVSELSMSHLSLNMI